MGRVMDAEGGVTPGAGAGEGGVGENFFTRGVVY